MAPLEAPRYVRWQIPQDVRDVLTCAGHVGVLISPFPPKLIRVLTCICSAELPGPAQPIHFQSRKARQSRLQVDRWGPYCTPAAWL